MYVLAAGNRLRCAGLRSRAKIAKVAELVDALALGASAARRAGSSPAFRTSPGRAFGRQHERARAGAQPHLPRSACHTECRRACVSHRRPWRHLGHRVSARAGAGSRDAPRSRVQTDASKGLATPRAAMTSGHHASVWRASSCRINPVSSPRRWRPGGESARLSRSVACKPSLMALGRHYASPSQSSDVARLQPQAQEWICKFRSNRWAAWNAR